MTAMNFECPTCGFRIFNRRLKRCESCGSSLSADLAFSDEQVKAIDGEEEKNKRGLSNYRTHLGLEKDGIANAGAPSWPGETSERDSNEIGATSLGTHLNRIGATLVATYVTISILKSGVPSIRWVFLMLVGALVAWALAFFGGSVAGLPSRLEASGFVNTMFRALGWLLLVVFAALLA